MPTPMMGLWGIVFPLLAAGTLWTLWWVFSRRHTDGRAALVTAALPVPTAFLLAFYAADPLAPFPPRLAVDWLFYSCVGLLAVVLAEAALRPWSGLASRLTWPVAVAVMVIPVTAAWRGGLDADFNPRSPVWAWTAVLLWMLAFVALRGLAGRLAASTPMTAVWLLGLTSAVGAVVLGLSGSQFAMPFRSASLGLALLPLLGVLLLQSRSGFRPGLPAPTVSGWTFLASAVVLAGHLWYALTAINGVLLLGGVAVAGLLPGRWPWLRLAVGLLPPLAALAWAGLTFARAQQVDPYAY